MKSTSSQDALPPPILQSGHIPALDGFRGLAVLMVMALHFLAGQPSSGWVSGIVVRLAEFGGFGVELFFILSGFLITGILWDTKDNPNFFRNFYIRRCLRIMPLYYGVFIVIFLILRHIPYFQGPTMNTLVEHQAWGWSYLINFYIARVGHWGPPYLGHFWSLAVEEHFYLFWPLVIYFTSRRRFLQWCVGITLAAILLRIYLRYMGVSGIAIYTLTPCRLDYLCIGSMLAVLLRESQDRPQWLRVFLRGIPYLIVISVSLALLSYLMRSGTSHLLAKTVRELGYLSAFTGLFIIMLTMPATSWIGRFFTSRPMRFLGKYSYGIYVYHVMIVTFFIQRKFYEQLLSYWNNDAALALFSYGLAGFGFSILVSVISYHAYEKWFLRLKARF
jgi:peptidoglycan/LPS O-acetylase OafA/YrhL